MAIEAVVFDLDGVIVDSEQIWDAAKRRYSDAHGGTWLEESTRAMQGMSSIEWSRYMADALGVGGDPAEIDAGVVADMLASYRRSIPFLPGAVDAVRRIAQVWPLGLASSANRPVIDLVLASPELVGRFELSISTEEVTAGKPSPDVYLEVCRRLGVEPTNAAAIEDSTSGLRSAHSAGLHVIAIPNTHYPPDPEVLRIQSSVALDSIGELSAEVVRGARHISAPKFV